MRTPLVTIFEDTLNRCFSSALEATLGREVRDEVYRNLEKRGVSKNLVSSMFDNVAQVLMDVFGEGYRMIIHRTIVDLYKEYSQRIDFSYVDSLKRPLEFLRERVVVDHLRPRGSREDSLDSFFDQKNVASAEQW